MLGGYMYTDIPLPPSLSGALFQVRFRGKALLPPFPLSPLPSPFPLTFLSPSFLPSPSIYLPPPLLLEVGPLITARESEGAF